MTRSIFEPWEVSQDKPSPFEPIKFEVTNLAPCFGPQVKEEYIEYINGAFARGKPIQMAHRYDEFYKMLGHYIKAEIINGQIWVTFTPNKLCEKFWINIS